VAADNRPNAIPTECDFVSLFEMLEDRTWTEMRRNGESIGNRFQRCVNKQWNLSSRSV